MKEFDIFDDDAIQHRLEEQQKRIDKIRSTKKDEEMKIRTLLDRDKKLIGQYLKLAVCDGHPVTVGDDNSDLVLNPQNHTDTIAIYNCWRKSAKGIVIKCKKDRFSFQDGKGNPCANVDEQCLALEELTRCLEDSEEILSEINIAVTNAINEITYNEGKCTSERFYNTESFSSGN